MDGVWNVEFGFLNWLMLGDRVFKGVAGQKTPEMAEADRLRRGV